MGRVTKGEEKEQKNHRLRGKGKERVTNGEKVREGKSTIRRKSKGKDTNGEKRLREELRTEEK